MSYRTEMQITVEGEKAAIVLAELCPETDEPVNYADISSAATCFHIGDSETIKEKALEISKKNPVNVIIVGRGGNFDDVWTAKFKSGQKIYEYTFMKLVTQQQKLKELLYGIYNECKH